MHRQRLSVVVSFAALLGSAAVAHAETAEVQSEAETPTSQEIGAQLGAEAGGRTSPGGVFVGGSYLYRLTEVDWLDSRVGFTFGSGAAECFRDRDNDLVCDHAIVDGFAAEASVGVRRFFAGHGAFSPFVHGGLGVRLVSFSGDDLRGVAIPLIAGAGVRSRVADTVAIFGSATLRAGLGWFGRDVGLEPHATAMLQVGVEFALD